MSESILKEKLRTFILADLIGNPDYPLKDSEGMVTGSPIDSFSLARVGLVIEDEFGVFIPDPDLTVAKMDTLNQMVVRIMER